MTSQRTAPTPRVDHLPTILRGILSGKIRAPAFQREFVWKKPQVLELLESVVRGFPIGSILLWRVDGTEIKQAREGTTPFPTFKQSQPFSAVLDGLQRLSVLFGTIHAPRAIDSEIFRVGYDLRLEEFFHIEGRDDDLDPHMVPLSVLSDPRNLIKAQAALSTLSDGVELVGRSLNLQAAFQEYMVPSITIEDMDPVEVVEVFERVNTTGTKLDAVDFMRAVTWSPEFDLNDQLSSIAADLKRQGFKVPEETIAKTIAVVRGRDPNSASILGLRLAAPALLHKHSSKAQEACLAVCAFLREEVGISSYELLPYEGQWIVLAALFASGRMQDSGFRRYSARWLWALSFNEGLRGKPDHYVSRTLAAFKQARSVDALPPLRLDLQPAALKDRRFTKGKALSSGFAGLFATHGPLSLTDGRSLADVLAAGGAVPDSFTQIFDLAELRGVTTHQTSGRVFANLVFSSQKDARVLQALGLRDTLVQLGQRLSTEDFLRVLSSQFLPPNAVELLEQGAAAELLTARSVELVKGMKALVEQGPPTPC